MKIILSIKPEFAAKIFEGTKKYEFRRAIFKNKNVKKVVVYASSPVQKIIGEFEIEDIIKKVALNKDFDTRYVLKDKVKKGQQEMASMFVSFLKTAMPVLSKDLQNKSQEEIYHELDRYFEKEILHLLTYISKEEQEIVTYYELTTLMTKIIANDKKTSKEIKEYFENLIEGK